MRFRRTHPSRKSWHTNGWLSLTTTVFRGVGREPGRERSRHGKAFRSRYPRSPSRGRFILGPSTLRPQRAPCGCSIVTALARAPLPSATPSYVCSILCMGVSTRSLWSTKGPQEELKQRGYELSRRTTLQNLRNSRRWSRFSSTRAHGQPAVRASVSCLFAPRDVAGPRQGTGRRRRQPPSSSPTSRAPS